MRLPSYGTALDILRQYLEITTFVCFSISYSMILKFKGIHFNFCHCHGVLSRFSHVWLCATPWPVTHQAPLSMGFSRKEYWSSCHALLQEIIPTQGLNPLLLHPLHWQVGSLPPAPPGVSISLLGTHFWIRWCTFSNCFSQPWKEKWWLNNMEMHFSLR